MSPLRGFAAETTAGVRLRLGVRRILLWAAEEVPDVAEALVLEGFALEVGAFGSCHSAIKVGLGFVSFSQKAGVYGKAVINQTGGATAAGKFLECLVSFLCAVELVQGICEGQPHGSAVDAFSSFDEQATGFDTAKMVFEAGLGHHRSLEDVGVKPSGRGDFLDLEAGRGIVLSLKPFPGSSENVGILCA
jgi:hypothetical protein